MSPVQATPAAVWPYVEAGCNLAEIAAWFGISADGAAWHVLRAKRLHLRPFVYSSRNGFEVAPENQLPSTDQQDTAP